MTLDLSKIPKTLVEAVDLSVAAAQHLDERNIAAVLNLRMLAWKIDNWHTLSAKSIEEAEDAGDRPRIPQNDNVSPSAFAKACDALGLTPVGLKAIEAARFPNKPNDDAKGVPDGGNGEAPEGRVESIAERRAAAAARRSS